MINKNVFKRNNSGIWVLAALPGEFDNPNANIAYTGVGKINASMTAQKIIDAYKPKLITNYGTAGSSKFNYGTIVSVNKFVQRDMNLTEFWSPKYVVPGSKDPQILEYGDFNPDYPRAICGDGDTFVRNIKDDIWNIVSMETFALAYVCRANGIRFKSYKFISDGAEHTTDKMWEDVLGEAKSELNKLYEKEFNIR